MTLVYKKKKLAECNLKKKQLNISYKTMAE